MEDVNNTKVCPNSGDQDGNEDICKYRNLAIFGYKFSLLDLFSVSFIFIL